MTILVECADCNGQFRIGAEHAGKRIRCPGCQGVVTVPAAERPVTSSQQKRTRPARPAPQPATESRRRRESRDTAVRQPRDPNRYIQTNGAPWKIMLGAAGAVVTLGVVGSIIFNFLQGDRSSSDVAKTDPTVESNSAAPELINDQALANPSAADRSSIMSPADSVTVGNSTSIGIVPGTTSFPTMIAGTQPPVAGNGTFGSIEGSGAAVAPSPAANIPATSLPALTPPAKFGGVPATESVSIPAASSDSSTSLAASETDLNIRDLFARVKGSVVRVNVSSSQGAGNGSGFVIDSAGIVATNYHVIAGSNRAWVEFANKDRILVTGLLFMDHKRDIAILKFDATLCSSLLMTIPVAKILPETGTEVVAIGAPLGLDMSVTEGIVSATRTADELKTSIGLRGHAGTWIQTTAAISPGNSGGPLITKRGEVVAINTLSLAGGGAQALNFGISCDDIRYAMTALEDEPIQLNPIVAPEMDENGKPGESDEDGIEDIAGTPQGDKLLAELRKVVILFLPATFEDPRQTVVSAVRSEVRQVLEKSGVEESLISTDKAALLTLMKLERSGTRLVLYVTAHVLVQDNSSGRPHAYKIWERTGEVGSISQQSILSGNLPANLRREIKDFFGKLRADILKARKTVSGTTN